MLTAARIAADRLLLEGGEQRIAAGVLERPLELGVALGVGGDGEIDVEGDLAGAERHQLIEDPRVDAARPRPHADSRRGWPSRCRRRRCCRSPAATRTRSASRAGHCRGHEHAQQRSRRSAAPAQCIWTDGSLPMILARRGHPQRSGLAGQGKTDVREDQSFVCYLSCRGHWHFHCRPAPTAAIAGSGSCRCHCSGVSLVETPAPSNLSPFVICPAFRPLSGLPHCLTFHLTYLSFPTFRSLRFIGLPGLVSSHLILSSVAAAGSPSTIAAVAPSTALDAADCPRH